MPILTTLDRLANTALQCRRSLGVGLLPICEGASRISSRKLRIGGAAFGRRQLTTRESLPHCSRVHGASDGLPPTGRGGRSPQSPFLGLGIMTRDFRREDRIVLRSKLERLDPRPCPDGRGNGANRPRSDRRSSEVDCQVSSSHCRCRQSLFFGSRTAAIGRRIGLSKRPAQCSRWCPIALDDTVSGIAADLDLVPRSQSP